MAIGWRKYVVRWKMEYGKIVRDIGIGVVASGVAYMIYRYAAMVAKNNAQAAEDTNASNAEMALAYASQPATNVAASATTAQTQGDNNEGTMSGMDGLNFSDPELNALAAQYSVNAVYNASTTPSAPNTPSTTLPVIPNGAFGVSSGPVFARDNIYASNRQWANA